MYDKASEIPKCDDIKARQCKERRGVLGTEQNLEDSSNILFSEEVLRLVNNSGFLRIDHSDD
jgi:hypothetical protein